MQATEGQEVAELAEPSADCCWREQDWLQLHEGDEAPCPALQSRASPEGERGCGAEGAAASRLRHASLTLAPRPPRSGAATVRRFQRWGSGRGAPPL